MNADMDSIVTEIKREKGVDAVYLFGSRARGTERAYSDVDICVITSRGADRKSILSNSSKKIDMNIFWDMPINLRYRVIKEGKPLFVRDELAMHKIKVGTVLSYLDFKPLLNRHFSRIIGG